MRVRISFMTCMTHSSGIFTTYAKLTFACHTAGGSHPHGRINSKREYNLRSIVDEDETRYHIEWEDDEVTGRAYENTWEPKHCANQAAIDDWERQKAEKASKQSSVF